MEHEGDSPHSLKATPRRIEVELIVKAIRLHRGNMTRVTRALEVSRTTSYRNSTPAIFRSQNRFRQRRPSYHTERYFLSCNVFFGRIKIRTIWMAISLPE